MKCEILNPGDTDFKVGDIMPRARVEKANRELGAKKQPAEFEAHCDYLSAWEEDKYIIAQANVELDEKGRIVPDLVNARQAGNFVLKHRDEIEYMDVSPKQLVSVAASLIPFLENDDANRALMGSNMQRQAVPLLRADAPYVGTGMERVTARDSGAVVLCKRAGVVDSVDSERIIVRVEGNGARRPAFARSGRRHLPADQVQALEPEHLHQPEADRARGPAGREGRGAGRRSLHRSWANWLWAATCWWRSCPGAVTTSKTPSWSAKSWSRKTTTPRSTSKSSKSKRATPSSVRRKSRATFRTSPRSFLRNLDESGIIRIGATVKPGDILVGKVTPKGETQLTPEEKLLRAIFGEKAGDVKDASLYCPPGIEGTVVDCKVFSRKGQEKDERSQADRRIADRAAAAQPGGRNPHPDRRARQAPRQPARRQGSCWPTCTTKRPTRSCSRKAPTLDARHDREDASRAT